MKVTIVELNQQTCPFCGGNDLDYDVAQFEGNMVYHDVTCCGCGRSFEEWYELVYAGVNVLDKAGHWIEVCPGDEGTQIEVEEN